MFFEPELLDFLWSFSSTGFATTGFCIISSTTRMESIEVLNPAGDRILISHSSKERFPSVGAVSSIVEKLPPVEVGKLFRKIKVSVQRFELLFSILFCLCNTTTFSPASPNLWSCGSRIRSRISFFSLKSSCV